MRVTKFRTELNDDLCQILVKESSCNYSICDKLSNADMIVEMLNDVFRLNKQTEEFVYLLCFNTKMKLLGVFEVSHGIVNSSFCNPREIFVRSLLCGASSIIIAHNHPSQDMTPSQNDIDVYERIKQTGKLIGINLLDSIIVGDGYYSFHNSL